MRELVLNIFYGIAYVLNGFRSPVVTSGQTPLNKHVHEGQEWVLGKDISSDLKRGIFVITQYGGDRVLIKRKDGRHDAPIGALPIYEIGILDHPDFRPLTGSSNA
jgi:hypothetical protein